MEFNVFHSRKYLRHTTMCHFLISLNFYIAYNEFFLSNTLSSFTNFTRIRFKQKRIENERKKTFANFFLVVLSH